MKLTFEEQLQKAIQSRILAEVKTTAFTRLEYNQRHKVPDDILSRVWASIDWEAVMIELRPQLQTRICNAIIGNMETELKTDIKKLLAIQGVRERLRIEVYPKLMHVLEDLT